MGLRLKRVTILIVLSSANKIFQRFSLILSVIQYFVDHCSFFISFARLEGMMIEGDPFKLFLNKQLWYRKIYQIFHFLR